MTFSFPPEFLQRLQSIIPTEFSCAVLNSLVQPRCLSIRINFLKISEEQALTLFKQKEIAFQRVPWCAEALILNSRPEHNEDWDSWFEQGLFYRQGLSSMLVVHLLDPRPGEAVLDLCAAPGSKTSHMAARMQNQGEITACEAIRGRIFKLKSVLKLLDVQNVHVRLLDARRYRSQQQFDRILVDAPCSSEGRFFIDEPESYQYWSPRKIKEMVRKQRGILLNATRLLKPQGTLVYSTCTFAPEENEGVLDWVLRKTERRLRVVPIEAPQIEQYPAIKSWGKRDFDPQVRQSLRVLPNRVMEGFFIAKLTADN